MKYLFLHILVPNTVFLLLFFKDHVHAMLARCLEKDKTFRKHMDKVDRDESGSLSSKEWRRLLAKLKKKDHASDSGLLESLVSTKILTTRILASSYTVFCFE